MQIENMFNDICKASTINATKALSKVLKTPVGVNIQSIEINHIEDINKFTQPDEMTVNLFMPIKGKLAGASFLLYPQKSAFAICDILFKRTEGRTQAFNDSEISALEEIGNIVIGQFLTSFANSLQMDFLVHRAPSFDCAPFSVISDQILQIINNNMKNAVLKISFTFQHSKIKGRVLIVFDEDKVNGVLKDLSSTSKA